MIRRKDASLRRRLATPASSWSAGNRFRPIAAAGLVILILVAACAIPGQLYVVAPEISGSVKNRGIPNEGVRLLLRIQHRESPNLYHVGQVSLSPVGGASYRHAPCGFCAART